VAKLDTTGSTFVYSTYLGSQGSSDRAEALAGIALDGAGNVYVTGRTTADDFPTTSDAMQPDFGGGSDDAVVSKLNPDGSVLIYRRLRLHIDKKLSIELHSNAKN
jgi:hypothetical protein